MKEDTYFDRPMKAVPPFAFNQGVADCFDDMVSRSVPYYGEIHRILVDLLPYRIRPEDRIYDLGCSTGTVIRLLSDHLKGQSVSFVGLDQSSPMVSKARKKCASCEHPITWVCEDILDHLFLESGLVVMNYTLQFIDKSHRASLMEKIYRSLRVGGTFFLCEKIESKDEEIERFQSQLYRDFKRRNGYSELEIAQKREALENVLVPLPPESQLNLLKSAGFDHVDMIFRWFNFACFIGIKARGT
ncbi:MAG: carboxy-S-adenosyl-L-methionine synthase CmoA [Bacteriovoracales bacterium]|nr:carboxy-S-adenosyl-L-methionine synthase CmoA [Bacteriovoracales bacterium]